MFLTISNKFPLKFESSIDTIESGICQSFSLFVCNLLVMFVLLINKERTFCQLQMPRIKITPKFSKLLKKIPRTFRGEN